MLSFRKQHCREKKIEDLQPKFKLRNMNLKPWQAFIKKLSLSSKIVSTQLLCLLEFCSFFNWVVRFEKIDFDSFCCCFLGYFPFSYAKSL